MTEVGTPHTAYFDSLQIINVEVNVEKFSHDYYNKLRNIIKKKIQKSDMIIINFIPNKLINDKWIFYCLLDLQRDFTDIITIPNNNLEEENLNEWSYSFNPQKLVKIL